MKCTSCLQGTPWECREKGACSNDINPNGDSDLGDAIGTLFGTVDRHPSEVEGTSHGDDPDPESFGTYKDDSALKDQQSTGRKRAAKLYPLDETAPCDWRMKKNCGGGSKPIIGCSGGMQEARHHGPDKNTLNNERGNVHRICHTCHNRWHTLNDEGYVWGGVYDPHSPIEASITDVGLNEAAWKGRKVVKARD